MLIRSFEYFSFNCDKRVVDFTENNWKSPNELIKIYSGKVELKNETTWYLWWWDEKVMPILLILDSDKKIKGINSVNNGNTFFYAFLEREKI